ncbi:MAG: hypothetical protein HY042_12910 [Spirochaetia bacterium]|nr:hypothetical protein [Spirochaetia bacterium]
MRLPGPFQTAFSLLRTWQWVLSLCLVFALTLPVLWRNVPKVDLEKANQPAFSDWSHMLGTDPLGRDVVDLFARGGWETIVVAIPARLFTIALTLLLLFPGAAASQVDAPGWIKWTARIPDTMARTMQVIPSLLLALVLSGLLPMGGLSLFLAVILSDWPGAHRTAASFVDHLARRETVISSLAMGGGIWHRISVHMLPEFWGFAARLFITGLPGVVLTVATLAFLGIGDELRILGVEGWGSQIAENRNSLLEDPRLILVPAAGLSLLILAFTPLEKRPAAGRR